MCGSRGGTGGLDPLKNHKFIGFPCNTGPDPLKITKLPTSQHSTVGHYRPASKTPFQWRFAGRPIIALFGGLWSLAPLKKNNKVGPPLTKLSGSANGLITVHSVCNSMVQRLFLSAFEYMH